MTPGSLTPSRPPADRPGWRWPWRSRWPPSLATGCGVTRGDESKDLLMMIPNSPGGGYDQTGRAAVSVMERGGHHRRLRSR